MSTSCHVSTEVCIAIGRYKAYKQWKTCFYKINYDCIFNNMYVGQTYMHDHQHNEEFLHGYVPYTLKFSRGQYFADWLKKAEKRNFRGGLISRKRAPLLNSN